MQSLFLSLLAVAVVTLAGREAVRVARLSAALGQAYGVLLAAWTGALMLGGAAWAGAQVAVHLHPDARAMMVAFALILAGIELWFMRAPREPAEPTRSFGAIALVFASMQLTGTAGLLVFALAGAAGIPWLAGGGGILGAGAALTAAWAVGADWDRPVLQHYARLVIAAVLVGTGLWMGLAARGII